jgi:hypothetical protein
LIIHDLESFGGAKMRFLRHFFEKKSTPQNPDFIFSNKENSRFMTFLTKKRLLLETKTPAPLVNRANQRNNIFFTFNLVTHVDPHIFPTHSLCFRQSNVERSALIAQF